MAEFLFKKFVADKGQKNTFHIESAATSNEEEGNPVYPPARRILNAEGIDCSGKFARKITKDDYARFDYIIGMEAMNVRHIKQICGGDNEHKVYKLLDFTDRPRDIADPWYTHDFETTYREINEGLNAFYKFLKEQK